MRIIPAGAAGAAALGGYAFVEPYRFRLVTHRLEVDEQVPPLSILHLSDTHMTSRAGKVKTWVEGIPEALGVVPDLILATGDFIENDSGIALAVDALNGLDARLGRFYVLGSHDYYQSKFQPPTKYFARKRKPAKAPPARTHELEEGLQSQGWVALTNTTQFIETKEGRIRIAGVDDPYLHRHRTSHIERSSEEAAAIGLMHAPDVVSEFSLAGFDLMVAGHTHGGQVRLPLVGALVSNCTLPPALAVGPHRIGHSWLHVSPGLGNGQFTPIRFNCRPEATLLRLAPGGAG
ncbi:MAG: metallophosphoesterase [Actinobacteria bacterium]|nr:metallophosphoesterase [Actinomycetota bacterium]